MVSCMATKTISLELDAYEKLRAAKRPGESFSATVRRAAARFGPSDSTGRSVLTLLQNLNAEAADREAAEYWTGTSGGSPDRDPVAVARRRMKLVDTDLQHPTCKGNM